MATQRSTTKALASIDIDDFDWSAYESTYQGRALIIRLQHLISTCRSHSSPQSDLLAHAALLRLIPLIKSTTWDLDIYYWAVSTLYALLNPGKWWKTNDVAMEVDGTDGAEDDGSGMGRGGLYGKIIPPGRGREGDGFPDEKWVDDTREAYHKEYTRLDVELRGYVSNLIKESIRLTQLALAQLALKTGNINEALKYFSGAREHSVSNQHNVDLGVSILEACLAFNLPGPLTGHIAKLESVLDRVHPHPSGPAGKPTKTNMTTTLADLREREVADARSLATRRSVLSRIRVGRGLLALSQKEWARAGREMNYIDEEAGGLGDWEGKAISTGDVALITAFTVLASSDRARIQRLLLDRQSFRASVGDNLPWVLELVQSFVGGKYDKVMLILHDAQPTLLLNPFLAPSTRNLIHHIQTSAITQYITPFSTISLPNMASAFTLTYPAILEIVEKLVSGGDVKGKIDLIDGVLMVEEMDVRGEMFEKALGAGKKAAEMSEATVLKMKFAEAGIVVDPRPKVDRSQAPQEPSYDDYTSHKGLELLP
ncbi:hypothetical protein B9479_002482 [Cryptococcus floricola]|uniref:PCI domain-containing protein n=1 Tax=Cryptococcus floricola TaxID=2591691 RepID=A0A5D3B2X4_9TREE|nr:hypothetical protein B9479_002482 [Cryptococcus floricola]